MTLNRIAVLALIAGAFVALPSADCAPGVQQSASARQQTGLKNIAGRWQGVLSGNDPQVEIILELKGPEQHLSGVLTWLSTTSGNNKRKV